MRQELSAGVSYTGVQPRVNKSWAVSIPGGSAGDAALEVLHPPLGCHC